MVRNEKPPRLLLMERLRNKKVFSACSNVPGGLYSGPGDHINSAEKVEDCSSKHFSDSPTKNESAGVFLRAGCALKATLAEDHPVPLGMATCGTHNKGETEAKVNGDKTPGQVTPSAGFSAFTVADFGMIPESLTRQQMGESMSLLKKWRRRSTIGARGSPENNALIQYIAHQKITKMEKPSSQASPFQHRSVLLKDKIAAFQSSFKPLEETEEGTIQKPNTSKDGGPGLLEWHLECKSLAAEEDPNDQSTQGKRTSADLQVYDMVSPLQKPLTPGTAILSKAIPALAPSAAESRCLPFEATPVTDVPKTARGLRSQRHDEELSSSPASQQSSKKVRFAEKESLEIFDTSKPPVTPLQKGQFSSSVLYHDGSCLRSVLKRPQEVFDDSKKGTGAPLVFGTCGLLQIESNTGQASDTEDDGKNQDANVLTPRPLLDALLLRGAGPCSPSGSSHCSPNYSTLTPIKEPLSQPDFDNEDDLPPDSSEAESAADSDLAETKNSSPDPQATCCRITRSSRKKKLVRAANTEIHRPTELQSNRAPTSKIPKANKVEKAKKATASRRKAFGKRRRKKKEQEALYGQRETVSKKPLLSPIPEMKEELSFASYQSTPKLQISTLDDSDSSDACEGHMDKMERKENGALQNPVVDCSGLNISLDLVKEVAVPDIQLVSSQLQDAMTTAGENTLPWDPPEKPAPAKLKGTINTDERVLRSDCSSNESAMQKELECLPGDVTGRKSSSRRELDLLGDSALELRSEVNVNFKRFPRRSRRLSLYLPNSDDVRPDNNVCVPRSPLEELLPTSQTVNDSVLLNDLQRSIEESFRPASNNNPKRVRRSMRGLKDAGNSGLAWIEVPAHDLASQTGLGCASTAPRQKCPSNPEELGCLSQKQARYFQVVEEQESAAPVVMSPCRSKAGRRRRSFYALRPEETENVALPSRRNRRASLGYRSDRCYQKDPEFRKLLLNRPTLLI